MEKDYENRISDERIAHMHGVSEYMYAHAGDFNAIGKDKIYKDPSKPCLIPEDMYILGLLHDVGYLQGKSDHEEYGAVLLAKNGYGADKVAVIEKHGCILDEVKDIIPELVLLIEADMHIDTDVKGLFVSFDKRLENVGKRHGFDSQAYKICKANIEWLRCHGRD